MQTVETLIVPRWHPIDSMGHERVELQAPQFIVQITTAGVQVHLVLLYLSLTISRRDHKTVIRRAKDFINTANNLCDAMNTEVGTTNPTLYVWPVRRPRAEIFGL